MLHQPTTKCNNMKNELCIFILSSIFFILSMGAFSYWHNNYNKACNNLVGSPDKNITTAFFGLSVISFAFFAGVTLTSIGRLIYKSNQPLPLPSTKRPHSGAIKGLGRIAVGASILTTCLVSLIAGCFSPRNSYKPETCLVTTDYTGSSQDLEFIVWYGLTFAAGLALTLWGSNNLLDAWETGGNFWTGQDRRLATKNVPSVV